MKPVGMDEVFELDGIVVIQNRFLQLGLIFRSTFQAQLFKQKKLSGSEVRIALNKRTDLLYITGLHGRLAKKLVSQGMNGFAHGSNLHYQLEKMRLKISS